MSVLTRLVQPFSEMVRWAEPWDVEDDDPASESPGGRRDDAFTLSS